MPPQKKQTEPAKAKAAVAAKPASKAKKVAAPAPAPVPVPPPVEVKSEGVVEDAAAVNPSDSTIKEFAEFQLRLSTIRTNLSNLLQDFKTLQKKTCLLYTSDAADE